MEIIWEEESEEALAASWKREGEKWIWGVTYMRHKRKENFEIMGAWMDKNKDGIIIINGDFNARTAEDGGLWLSTGERETRKSKDKTDNIEGKELIGRLEENGMGIGNGAMEGDEEGEWTYVGSRGCTSIDYGIRNEKGREKIKKMWIGDRIKSDHMPMEMIIEWEETIKKGERIKKFREVINWNKRGRERFRERLTGGKKNSWRELKEKIRDALPIEEK